MKKQQHQGKIFRKKFRKHPYGEAYLFTAQSLQRKNCAAQSMQNLQSEACRNLRNNYLFKQLLRTR